MKHKWVYLKAVAAATAVSLAAGAEPVAPGESFTDEDVDGFVMPTGAELARQTLPFTIEFRTLGGVLVDDTVSGTLTNTVLRDDTTGRLTFVYDVDVELEDRGKVNETGVLTARGFAGFLTDVDGDFDSVFTTRRSADGAELRAEGLNPGLIEAPVFIVRTDATEFDAGGSLLYETGDEFPDPEGEIVFARGSFTFQGTYQPAADNGVVIPLPAPLAMGLAGLGGLGLVRAGRRMKRLRPS